MSNIINYIEYGFMAMSYCNREGINNCKTNEVNPLNPNIKIQILICYSYTFSIEVVGRICWSINLDSSCVIMSLILMTTLFYKAVILHGEIWRWSLLGLKRVNFVGIPTRRKSSYSGVSDAISLSHVLLRAIFCVSHEKVLCTVGKYKPWN